MGLVIEIPCPGCERVIKVPESAFGKKLKCKHCGEKIEVEQVNLDDLDDEDDDPKPKKKKPAGKVDKPATVGTSKPGGAVKKKEEPKPAPPPAAAAPLKFADEDDEGDGGAKPNPLGVIDEGEDVARCPHCAKELDPPDAIVCIHCGFNNQTRTKAESKTTWAPSGEDWFHHLLPGILALIGFILLLVLNIMSLLNMRDWLTDTLLMKDTKNSQGEVDFWVKPGAFIAFILAATILPMIGMARFAVKRLIINNTPEEKVKA